MDTHDAADDKPEQTKSDTAAPPETVYRRDTSRRSLMLPSNPEVESGGRRPFTTCGLNLTEDLRRVQRTQSERKIPPEVPPKPAYLSEKSTTKQSQQQPATSAMSSIDEDAVLSKFAVYVTPVGRTETTQGASAGPSQGASGSRDTLPPGLYYFNGEHLVSAPQQGAGEYFHTGSDYVRVISHGPEDDDDDDPIDEVSSDSEPEQDGVQVQSTLKGVSTLNINIQLNLADLLAPQCSSRRRKPRKARRKPRRGIYEVCDLRDQPGAPTNGTGSPRGPGPDRVPGVPGAGSRLENTEAVEHPSSLRDLSPARSHPSVEGEPPMIPPKTYRSKSESDIRLSTKDDDESSDVDSLGYEKFSNADDQPDMNGTQEPPEPVQPDNEMDSVPRRRRLYSVPTPGEQTEWRKGTELEEDPLYDKVTESVYDCYNCDIKIRDEVKRLESIKASWFHLYNSRENALKKVDLNTEGSFVVVAENIENKPLHPFTLYVNHRETVKEIPIAKTSDRGGKKYKILDEKPKKSIYDLISFYCKNPLPYFKTTLRLSQHNKNTPQQASSAANT